MELFFLINNTLTNHIYKFRVDLIGNLLTIQSPVVRKKNETNKNKQEKERRFISHREQINHDLEMYF